MLIGDKFSPHFIKWAEAQKKIGFNITILSLKKKHHHTSFIKIYLFLILFFKGIYLIKKKNIEILHCHYIGKYALIAYLLSLYKNKLVLTAWGSDINLVKNKLKLFLLKKILKRSKLITHDADHIAHKIKAIYSEVKLKHVEFGVDTDFFHDSKLSPISIKNLFIKYDINYENLNENTKFLLSNRNLEEIYNIETIIKSILKLPEYFVLLIAGSGSNYDKLSNLVSELNLEERVFFTGPYNQTNLLELFAVTDIFISASKYDAGLSISVAEAMSCRVPVIVSNNSDNKRWIIPNKTGWLFDTLSSSDLANKIEMVSKINDTEMHKILNKSREIICENNSLPKSMNKMSKIYKSL